jgi:hypothetical protein
LVLVLLAATLIPAAPGLAQMPTGSASVDLSLPTLAAPVSPAEAQNTSATVRYEWQDGTSDENVTVELGYEDGPDWLNSSFTPSTVEFDLGTQASGVETRIVNVTLNVSSSALAYTEAEATYTASAEASGTLPGARASEQLPLEAGFAGELNAGLSQGNVTAWGGILEEIPIELENTANGPIEVEVVVDRVPADARTTAPETITLGREDGNRTTTASLDTRVPWSLSVEGPVELLFQAQHVDEGTELADERAQFHLEGNSAIPVPGPGPIASLLAAALALLLARSSPDSSRRN